MRKCVLSIPHAADENNDDGWRRPKKGSFFVLFLLWVPFTVDTNHFEGRSCENACTGQSEGSYCKEESPTQ
jgi:hypothetical protein